MFQETCDKISKQEEEEIQWLRETYHKKQHKMVVDLSSNELKLSQETYDKKIKRQGKF